MTEVKGGVINNMQNCPAQRHLPPIYAQGAIQIRWRKRPKNFTRLLQSPPQNVVNFIWRRHLSGELRLPVAGARQSADYLSNPKMLCTTNVQSKHRQRIDFGDILTCKRAPVKRIHRQISQQSLDLSVQVCYPKHIIK